MNSCAIGSSALLTVGGKIRIDMPFDKLLFDGGLRSLGTLVRTYRGTERYRINHYRDLNPLLGVNWHFCGLNCNGDFSYAILASVQFYVYKEYVPSTSGGEPTLQSTDLDMLVFTFVRGPRFSIRIMFNAAAKIAISTSFLISMARKNLVWPSERPLFTWLPFVFITVMHFPCIYIFNVHSFYYLPLPSPFSTFQ